MMKILVTGGAGFIGSDFVKYWLSNYNNGELVVLDSLTYAGRKSNLKEVLGNPKLSLVKGSITNKKLVDRLVADVDLVVHFAAESHVDRSVMGPGLFVRTNVWGTYVLLEAIRKYRVRFHHVSTDEVYGSLERGSGNKFREDTPYDPRSPYSASKAGSDHLVRAYFHTYGCPVTITNCSNNYGPFQFPEKLIPLAITNLLVGMKVPVYGDGGQIRDWLYVEDHCRAIDMVVRNGRVGETYLVGGLKKEVTNLDLVRLIVGFLNESEEKMIEFVDDRPGHDQKYAVDYGKIERELGWKPEVRLEDGLMKTIDWYKNNVWWWGRIRQGKFKEYYAKKYR